MGGIGKCGCRCGGDPYVRAVLSVVPFNFFQSFKPGVVDSGSPTVALPSTTAIGRPDYTDNTSKYLRRVIGNTFTGSYVVDHDETFTRTTGQWPGYPGSFIIVGVNPNDWWDNGWDYSTNAPTDAFTSPANPTTDNYNIIYRIEATAFKVTFFWRLHQVGFFGTITKDYTTVWELFNEVTYLAATADANALLADINLLVNRSTLTVIDPTTLSNASSPLASTGVGTPYRSFIVCQNLKVLQNAAIYANWPASGHQQIGNGAVPITPVVAYFGGRGIPVCAQGIPAIITGSTSVFMNRFPDAGNVFTDPSPHVGSQLQIRWDPLTAVSNATDTSRIDFLVSMKTALKFNAGIENFLSVEFDPIHGYWSQGPTGGSAAPGEHIYTPDDLGGVIGAKVALWNLPTGPATPQIEGGTAGSSSGAGSGSQYAGGGDTNEL